LFVNRDNSYAIKNRQVYITKKSSPTVVADSSTRSIQINGTVIDKENEPLIGVSIAVKGTPLGTVTDINGHFFLNVPKKEATLAVSYVGFIPQEIVVGDKINFPITLQEDVAALDEVVVTGYGLQKKVSVVGSIVSLEPSKLRVGTSRTLTNNIAGQLAGVIAVQRSGEPGYDGANFWIRGISTFSGSTAPLVLVDGIERTLGDLDPAEIESFSVLKDAAASAMYGVRGANGIIVVNTKRGTVAPPSVDFRIEQSVQTPTKLPKFLGAVDYMNLLNDLAGSEGKPRCIIKR
jgi:TonB-dependent SusC/RagA subfamily outer membrane receptor